MAKLTVVVTSLLSLAFASHGGERYTPDWASIDSRPLPGWYDEAKFGIFIHWGVFSVPSFGSEVYWWMLDGIKNPKFIEFHNRVYGADFKYQDFAPMFQAKLFNPDNWAKMFKRAGAKYVVLTSKHHEGFTMWPSNVSWNWNAMDVGPHRDLVGDLAAAVRKEGLTYGLYHSLAEWFNPMYLQDKQAGFTNKSRDFVEKKAMPEVREIVEKYRPDLIWSDGIWEGSEEYWGSTEFLAWLYNDSPVKDTVVTNDRWCFECVLKHGGYYSGADRQQPGPGLLGHKWERCMTLDGGDWGYNRDSPLSNYLSARDVIRDLISTVAYGGNLLLNVGPTSDGLILPIFEERLAQIGDYLAVNGEAIYGTAPHGTVQDATTKGGPEAYITTKAGAEYLLTVGWPNFEERLAIPLPGVTAGVLFMRDGKSEQVECAPDEQGGNSSSCVVPIAASLALDPNGLVLKLTRSPSRKAPDAIVV